MADFASLFKPQSVEAPKHTNSNEYRVSYRQGKGGVYESIIRFIVNWENPERCIVNKGVTYLKNPISGIGKYIDDPRTVGEPSPCRDFFGQCWATNNAAVQDFAKKNCSTKDQFASLIQVIKDDQHPELVGKILVMTYGSKLWAKLNDEEHPTMGEGINPFHPIYGRHFHLKCTAQGQYNDFTQSYFFDNKVNNQIAPSGIWYIDPANPGKYTVATENSSAQTIYEYLQANSPSLKSYEYRPWDAETTKFVNETLSIFTSHLSAGKIPSAQASFAGAPSMQQTAAPVFPGATMAPSAPGGFAAPAGFGIPAPAAPAAPVGFDAPATPGGFAAPAAPATPAAPVAAPAPTGFGGLQGGLGGFSMGGSNVAPAQAPAIIGVELPNTGATPAPQAAPAPQMGIGGTDLETVLAGL